MQQATTPTEGDICPAAIGPISRRMLMAGGAGLVGATALAVRPAQAQGNPPSAVLPIQAPVRQEWLDKRPLKPGDYAFAAAFGPGFSAEFLLLQWT